MSPRLTPPARFCAFALIALFAASPAAADRPSRDESGASGKHEKKGEKPRKEHKERKDAGKFYFSNDSRRIVNDYYSEKFRSGKCPPGLAKKKNGCLPPGQAKKWAVGQPLPTDAERNDLPNDLLIKLPIPPSGHRYVRVASDILLIAVGTSMVVDAIEDIGRQF